MTSSPSPPPEETLADLAERVLEVIVALPDLPADPSAPSAVLNLYGISATIAAALRPALMSSAAPGVMRNLDRVVSAAADILRKRLDPHQPRA